MYRSELHDMFSMLFVFNVLVLALGTGDRSSLKRGFTICFTICLFISPDLDGHRFEQKSTGGRERQNF